MNWRPSLSAGIAAGVFFVCFGACARGRGRSFTPHLQRRRDAEGKLYMFWGSVLVQPGGEPAPLRARQPARAHGTSRQAQGPQRCVPRETPAERNKWQRPLYCSKEWFFNRIDASGTRPRCSQHHLQGRESRPPGSEGSHFSFGTGS